MQVGVRVAFSHPTRPALVACQYYLEGKCNRGDSCRSCPANIIPANFIMFTNSVHIMLRIS